MHSSSLISQTGIGAAGIKFMRIPPPPPSSSLHSQTGIGAAGIKFMRIPNLAIFWAMSRMASTARARSRLWAEQYMEYGPIVPLYTMGVCE